MHVTSGVRESGPIRSGALVAGEMVPERARAARLGQSSPGWLYGGASDAQQIAHRFGAKRLPLSPLWRSALSPRREQSRGENTGGGPKREMTRKAHVLHESL